MYVHVYICVCLLCCPLPSSVQVLTLLMIGCASSLPKTGNLLHFIAFCFLPPKNPTIVSILGQCFGNGFSVAAALFFCCCFLSTIHFHSSLGVIRYVTPVSLYYWSLSVLGTYSMCIRWVMLIDDLVSLLDSFLS